MPSPATLLTFSLAALAVIVVPGPAVLYTVGRSVSQGRAHGLVSVLGVAVGGLVHTVAAAAGVSVLLARSAVAFSVVKYAGAAYLVYLGVQKLRQPSTLGSALQSGPRSSLRTTFVDGVVVNVLNPKTALFFLALLPQFVNPDRGPAAAQILVLGIVFVSLALVSDAAWALASSAVADRLKRNERALQRLDRGAGFIFIGLGVLAAFGHKPATEAT